MIKLLWDELKEVSQKVSLKKTRKAIYFLTRILNHRALSQTLLSNENKLATKQGWAWLRLCRPEKV